MRLMRMLAGVTVRRGVTAERDAACLARTQVHPLAAHLHACVALAALRDFQLTDGLDVRAGVCHNREPTMSYQRWAQLRYEDWKDTYATLHMWLQVAGKIAVAHAPAINHCWGSA